MNQNQDLVAKDYYEQELKFQERINQKKSADSIYNAVNVVFKDDSLRITFSNSFSTDSLSGTVWVYCPSDENKDVKKDFVLEKGNQQLVFPYFSKGNRYVKVDWKAKGREFYKEQQIFINN